MPHFSHTIPDPNTHCFLVLEITPSLLPLHLFSCIQWLPNPSCILFNIPQNVCMHAKDSKPTGEDDVHFKELKEK